MKQRTAWLYTFILFIFYKLSVISSSLFFVQKYDSIPSSLKWIQSSALDNFVRWDSLWYIRIAQEGYSSLQPAAFFPLFPWLMRFMSDLFGISYALCGIILVNIALFLGIYLLLRLLSLDYAQTDAIKTVALLVTFPTSFYFSAVYTESVFLFWIVGCFYFLRIQKWGWAALFGFFASLTRNTGLLLMLPFLYEYLASRNFKWRKMDADILSILLIPAGLFTYMALLFVKIGDPLGFMHAQKYWFRSFLWPWSTLWHGSLDILFKHRSGWTRTNRIMEAIAAYWEIILIFLSLWKRKLQLRFSYMVYMLGAVIVPLLSPSMSTSFFYSIPRFAIVIFPLFLVWALLLKQRRWFVAILLLQIAGQWYLMDKFTRGWFVF